MKSVVRHLINGLWDQEGSLSENVNPSNGDVICSFPIAEASTVNRAVSSARAASSAWANTPIPERVKAVESLIALIRDAYGTEGELTSIKRTIMDEIGKPLPEADIEVLEVADFMNYYADIASEVLHEKVVEINAAMWPTKRSTVTRKPYGVVAIIKPWNYPIEMIAWSLAPALLSGNTVVVKPSEKSPLSAYFLAQLIEKSSLPDGVVNFVFGDATTGQSLVRNPGIDYISFTGSVESGKHIAGAAARSLTPITLELGGNDPALVLADCDIDKTASGLVWGAFCNAGQVCVGIKRAYVVAAIYDQLLEAISARMNVLREGIDYGPIIDIKQLNSVEQFVDSIRQQDGTVRIGGKRGSRGYFYMPTLIEVKNESAAIFDQECFGPILPLIKVNSTDEAIRAANHGEFGLGASVWSKDLQEARIVADQLQCGMVWINDVNVAFPQAPWAGIKNSGVGFELSSQALHNYTYGQHLSVETNLVETRKPWWYPYGN